MTKVIFMVFTVLLCFLFFVFFKSRIGNTKYLEVDIYSECMLTFHSYHNLRSALNANTIKGIA